MYSVSLKQKKTYFSIFTYFAKLLITWRRNCHSLQAMQQYHNFLQRCSHHSHHLKFATLLKTPQNMHYKWRTTIISSWSLDNDLPALWACSLPGQLFRVTDLKAEAVGIVLSISSFKSQIHTKTKACLHPRSLHLLSSAGSTERKLLIRRICLLWNSERTTYHRRFTNWWFRTAEKKRIQLEILPWDNHSSTPPGYASYRERGRQREIERMAFSPSLWRKMLSRSY